VASSRWMRASRPSVAYVINASLSQQNQCSIGGSPQQSTVQTSGLRPMQTGIICVQRRKGHHPCTCPRITRSSEVQTRVPICILPP
jgi:hypothetical protein